MSEGRVLGGCNHALHGCAEQLDKRYQAETDAEEVLSEREEELLKCVGDCVLEQIAQRLWSLSY